MDLSNPPVGLPRPERADAARNRAALLRTARALVDREGAERVTMDRLAEQAGLGKGTVFRHFGTRAGIFRALLHVDEQEFQRRVLSGPPPLGPGADPIARLVAYGTARIAHMLEHQEILWASLERDVPVPNGPPNTSLVHIRMLLTQLDIVPPDRQVLAVQLTAALEGPITLHPTTTWSSRPTDAGPRLADGWRFLVERALVTG